MVNRLHYIILVGLLLLASCVSLRRISRQKSQSRQVSSYLYNELETYFNPSFAHVARPFFYKVEDFSFGVIYGFSNSDLD